MSSVQTVRGLPPVTGSDGRKVRAEHVSSVALQMVIMSGCSIKHIREIYFKFPILVKLVFLM